MGLPQEVTNKPVEDHKLAVAAALDEMACAAGDIAGSIDAFGGVSVKCLERGLIQPHRNIL